MARKRRSRTSHPNALEDLQAWQNHQYDPGYWRNLSRLRLFSGGRASPARWLLARLATVVAMLFLWIVLVSAGVHIVVATVLIGIIGGILLVASLAQQRNHRGRRSQRRGLRR